MPDTVAVKLLRIDDENGEWHIEIHNFEGFREKLGPDLLTCFCRCFVHLDRLISMVVLVKCSEKEFGGNSPAFERDLMTSAVFIAGTLREFGKAVYTLSKCLRARDLDTVTESKSWTNLNELSLQWHTNEFLREFRDQRAFHVDTEVIDSGLKNLDGTVVLAKGIGDAHVNRTLCLGTEALLGDFRNDEIETFHSVANHVVVALNDLLDIFLNVLRECGIDCD